MTGRPVAGRTPRGCRGHAAARSVARPAIQGWRDIYRAEMNCQIVHDALHGRPGWTEEYLLTVDDAPVGYGSVAVGGPWAGRPTAYELYVLPVRRGHLFELFEALIAASCAIGIEVQSNDRLAVVVLHAFGHDVTSESILFEDGITTSDVPSDAIFRVPSATEAPELGPDDRRWRGVVEVEGRVAATGGILFHYNRPFGDIYMEVAEPFRGRGLGSFLVQELKRVCYEGGHVPAARCHPENVASRRTLQRAGFVPCGHILKASLQPGVEHGTAV